MSMVSWYIAGVVGLREATSSVGSSFKVTVGIGVAGVAEGEKACVVSGGHCSSLSSDAMDSVSFSVDSNG